MPRYRLDVEYEGTRYSGWQVQPNARTVQGELGKAVQEAFNPRRFDLQGSGRTDAGVHALQQTAHLDLPTKVPPKVLIPRLNDLLPADINVLRATPVPDAFHARHDAVGRSYVYQISRRRSAFGKRLVWWIKDPLDTARMQQAAAHFVGLHDYVGFTADTKAQKDTRVKVEHAAVAEAGDLVLVRVAASHFLWKMVRQMIGVLADIGRGRLQPHDVPRLIKTPSDLPAKLTAPPSGLFLEGAWYPGEPAPYDAPLEPLLWVGS